MTPLRTCTYERLARETARKRGIARIENAREREREGGRERRGVDFCLSATS